MRVFIGSSSKQYPVVKEIKRDLREYIQNSPIQITDWMEWFGQGKHTGYNTWDIIEKALRSFDVAIMLFAKDDDIIENGNERKVTRDNVLIEAGAFASSLGIERVVILSQLDQDYRLPTDFCGLNCIKFNFDRGADNEQAYRQIIEKFQYLLEKEWNQVELSTQPLIKNQNPIRIRKGKGKIV